MKILNVKNVYCSNDNLTILFMIMTLTFVVFALCLFSDFYMKAGLIMCIIGAITFVTSIYFSYPKETDRKQYEVILDDNYPIKAIYEKYKVVENRGEIWVIEEKEIE